FALEHHIDALGNLEAVAFDRLHGITVAVEQRRGGDDELQLQVGMLPDRAQGRADSRVTGAGGDDDADLPFSRAHVCESPSMSSAASPWSAVPGRAGRRPMISWSRSGGRPVPGFLMARCSRARTVPAGRLALATRLRVNSFRSGAVSLADTSLSI